MDIQNRHHEKIQRLIAKKRAQTAAKLERYGYADEDDYGYVLPPEDFSFTFPVMDEDGSFHGADAWARNFRALLDVHPIHIDEDDAITGKWMFVMARLRSGFKLFKAPFPFDYSFLKEEQERYDITHGIGKDAHFSPDYNIGLKLGLGGIRDKVVQSLARHAGDAEAQELLSAELVVLDGIQGFIRRTAEAATGERRRINEKLVSEPPDTLLEACQWLAWFSIVGRIYNRGGSGVRLDRILLPFYERDIARGAIDDEDALYYIACLLLNETRYYQIGGMDARGNDQTNPLSFLILEAAHWIRSTCNLTIMTHQGMDARLFRRGVEILLEDQLGCPRFANGDALAAGYQRNGVPLAVARERIAAGCHWFSLPGLEYPLNDVVKINLAKVFSVALEEAEETGALSTDGIYALFLSHLRRAVSCVAKGLDFHLEHQYRNEPELVLNLICHGPIEKGRDMSHGGATYYNMCCDGAGLATVADSFAALETQVETLKRLTWADCLRALHDDFEGAQGEAAHAILASTPKFGFGNVPADAWAKRISTDFAALVTERKTPGGRAMIPGLFSWADTVRFGKTVPATPNGRRGGAPISHGANPDAGFRKDGAATAIAVAVAAIQPGYGNTAPLQLELDASYTRGEDAVDKVLALFQTHFDLGGTLINVNIVNADALREASRDPHRHPELIVRVTGFTAYYMLLSPEFKKLVLERVLEEAG